MTRVLGVSKSGFYARRRRPRTLRAMEGEVPAGMITTIHRDSRGTYGAPRVQAELRIARGIRCRRRVARLMRQEGLQGVVRRAGHPITTVRDPVATPARDLVDRDFHATAPNQLWVADITASARPRICLAVLSELLANRLTRIRR